MMDSKIRDAFSDMLNIDLVEIIISNSSKKELISKIKIRPVLLKGELKFQISEFRGKQVHHQNESKEDIMALIENWFDISDNEVSFKQVEGKCKSRTVHILISKKGNATVKIKTVSNEKKDNNLEHNRKKKYILEEGTRIPFLVDLNVMTKEGNIIHSRYDKFRQINRFLEFLQDCITVLPKDKKLTIIDFGCGKSYLTFAMYYYLVELNHYDVTMIGLDLKDDVIEHCNEMSRRYGYDNLTFLHGDIANYEGVNQVDMVVTLHACDTATDHALFKAMKWGAKVILSVPCCQHELNRQISCEELEPILKYGIVKERAAALFTDSFRAELLEANGYRTQLLEFIEMEHTPKNILIRGIKDPKEKKTDLDKMERCMEFLGVEPTLYKLLKEEGMR